MLNKVVIVILECDVQQRRSTYLFSGFYRAAMERNRVR